MEIVVYLNGLISNVAADSHGQVKATPIPDVRYAEAPIFTAY